MKHLVLLGSGPSHLRVLHELAAAPLPAARVTWVAPHGRHVLPSLLAGWIAGRVPAEACCVALAPLAARAGVTLVDSDALVVDAARRQVTLANGHTLEYDALSVDTPAVSDRDRIAGARENALFDRPADHFMRLWGALIALAEEQALSVVVVGDQVPAIELALAVHLRLGKRARVALVTGEGPPVPFHSDAFRLRVRAALKRGQVTLFEDRCEALFGNQMLLGRGLRLACDAPLVALAPGAPRWAPDSGLALDPEGLLQVGDTLQSVSHPEVFITGEVAVRQGGQRLVAGTVPFGRDAPLGLNLRRFVAGGALVARPAPSGGVQWLDVGQGRALASWHGLTASGRWLGWLKARGERRAVEALQAPGSAAEGAVPQAPSADL